jgi:hypothetical protein
MAAVLHLLRLVSAELVLFRGIDVQRFEKAMHEKISEFTSPVANQKAKEDGLAFARSLVDQVLAHIRAQVELKNTLAGRTASDSVQPTAPQSPLLHWHFDASSDGWADCCSKSYPASALNFRSPQAEINILHGRLAIGAVGQALGPAVYEFTA